MRTTAIACARARRNQLLGARQRGGRSPKRFPRRRLHPIRGIFRGGLIYVDVVGWPDQGRQQYGDRDGDRYERAQVQGWVERIDFRRGTVRIREENTRRRITIDMSRIPRTPFADFRISDVQISGRWSGDLFMARRIEDMRSGREH